MSKDRYARRTARGWAALVALATLVLLTLAVTWQIAFAQAPEPNPLTPIGKGGNPIFAPVPGVDITQNGDAVKTHGDPYKGRLLFALNCTTCHGDRGTDGAVNPGSDDGSVPLLNPIDPGFLEDSGGNPQQFAQLIDLFIQHGSRPPGDDPQISMIGWGDQKLLTQQQIADVEAYVMQLNGVYWSDRFYPPAEVQMSAIRSNFTLTYTINLINHGSSPLSNWTLRDTLPEGLAYVKSGIINLDGDNPAGVDGSTVMWSNQDMPIPTGGSLGPFIIVTRIQDPRNPIPANVAQLLFDFTTYDGTNNSTSAVSDPVAPATPKPTATATPVPTAAATPSASASPTPVAAAPTPVTAAPTPAKIAAKIVQPDPGALSWTFDPQALTVRVGDTVTWTNMGSLVHTVTADDGSFDSGNLNPGDSWSFTFVKAGTFAFHCTPHPWMKGTITVQP
ncbi:MAG: cupredoxin domain-containing protein [Chloroflexota bacterium]|nr:cupredoxin domain-containing protein [Chloroflexota bacterium]